MDYVGFINTVAQCQSPRIKPISIPESCCPGSIPSHFYQFIPDIVTILDEHFDEIADGAPYIGIFGLQSAGFTIQSNSSNTKKNSHLCAVLYYLPLRSQHHIKLTNWSSYKSIVIDFSCGIVMDDKRYLHTVLKKGDRGKVYGKLDTKRLTKTWNNFNSYYKN